LYVYIQTIVSQDLMCELCGLHWYNAAEYIYWLADTTHYFYNKIIQGTCEKARPVNTGNQNTSKLHKYRKSQTNHR